MSDSKPMYLQIHEEIQRQIHNQYFKSGDLLPAESELCKEYKASRPTVARALKMLSDEKLVRRKAGFGTQVLAPSRSSLQVGLLIPQIATTEIFEPICASIVETSGMEGVRIILPSDLTAGNDLKELTQSLTDKLIEARVKGVFFAPTEHVEDPAEFNQGIIDQLSGAGIHVVLLDRDIYRWPRQTKLDLISIDNVEAGYVIATHLIDQGCKRLAFVTKENPATTVQLRRVGCREALLQRGLDPKSLITVHHSQEDKGSASKELLENKIDGVICANDTTASTLMRSLLDVGAEIPRRLKVCGFDDVRYGSLLSVPLTTYQQPCIDIGKAAAKIMIQRITKPDAPVQRVTLQGKIIIRESSSSDRIV